MKKTKGLVSFAENILGADLWEVQREILNAIEHDRQVAVAACHGSGKSYVAAVRGYWLRRTACRLACTDCRAWLAYDADGSMERDTHSDRAC